MCTILLDSHFAFTCMTFILYTYLTSIVIPPTMLVKYKFEIQDFHCQQLQQLLCKCCAYDKKKTWSSKYNQRLMKLNVQYLPVLHQYTNFNNLFSFFVVILAFPAFISDRTLHLYMGRPLCH